ncbi:MAG TPA: hypothetical protein VNJ01_15795 [Bacteriovoracaceae bacterium]|nr:hypothetical protein [Bacteriovoracaceae bacterium]
MYAPSASLGLQPNLNNFEMKEGRGSAGGGWGQVEDRTIEIAWMWMGGLWMNQSSSQQVLEKDLVIAVISDLVENHMNLRIKND